MEMLYIVHIVREGIGVATGLGKNILVFYFTVKNMDFFIHLNNVDKTSCYELYKLRQNNNA